MGWKTPRKRLMASCLSASEKQKYVFGNSIADIYNSDNVSQEDEGTAVISRNTLYFAVCNAHPRFWPKVSGKKSFILIF